MKVSNSVFLVTKYGNSWKQNVGVCLTLEGAQKLKMQILDEYKKKCPIPINKFKEIMNTFYNKYSLSFLKEKGITYEEGLHLVAPEYNLEDISTTLDTYTGDIFIDVDIEELNLYN